MHLTPTLCLLHALLISYHQFLLRKIYMHLKPTLCVLHALLISYLLWFLPKSVHAFNTHNMRAACPNNILSSMLCTEHCTCNWNPQYACCMPYNYPVIYAFFQKSYMHLTPTQCVLHALLIFYYLCLLPNTVQAFDTTQYVLHASLIFYYLCLPPNTLHAFDTHTNHDVCPTKILSSMPSA